MSDLTDFLLARIADDRAAGRITKRDYEAKRLIVALADWTGPKKTLRDRVFGPSADFGFQAGIRASMCALAAVYADHPDYRPEWRP